jgi:hypothetical protein
MLRGRRHNRGVPTKREPDDTIAFVAKEAPFNELARLPVMLVSIFI